MMNNYHVLLALVDVDEDNVDDVIMSDLLEKITEKLKLNLSKMSQNFQRFYPVDFRSQLRNCEKS